MTTLPQLLRKGDWFTSKLPIAWGVYYLGLWATGAPPTGPVIGTTFLMLLAFIASGIFVRFYNDLFDMAADARGGKFNLASRVSPFWRILAPVLATAFIILILMILKAPAYLYGLMGLQHLLYILYSTPPVRLKNRGLAGALTDAAYGHAMPAVIGWAFAISLSDEAGGSFLFPAVVLLIITLQLLSGIKNILFHQVMDFEKDRAAAARTLVVVVGKKRAVNLGVNWLAPIEFSLLMAFLFYVGLSFQAPLLIVLSPFILVHILAGYRSYRRRDKEKSQLLLLSNEVYDTWLPIAFLGMLIENNSDFWLLLVFHLLVFFEPSSRRLYYYALGTKPVIGWIQGKILLFYYHWLLKQYARLRQYQVSNKAVNSKEECVES
ncbi:MAG: UbiA prenyltransferase family protein [Phaeodactylibacter sp.]|nr:UbiA prenyltransferase family protein [Phaeodactylibacter sp.]